MLLFSFPYLVEKGMGPGHRPPQVCIESHFNVNLCPVFYLKAYLRHTKPFKKKPDEWHVMSLFFG